MAAKLFQLGEESRIQKRSPQLSYIVESLSILHVLERGQALYFQSHRLHKVEQVDKGHRTAVAFHFVTSRLKRK
jgi:hypothetical protein